MSGANPGAPGRPPDVSMDQDGFTIPLPKKRGRGRPRKQRQDDDNSSIVTENSFASLTDDDEGDIRKPPKRNRVIKARRPPPIILPNLNTRVQVDDILKGVPVEQSKILRRTTKDGTKLFVSTGEDFKALRTHFGDAKVKFTSFTLHEDMVTRYVMYGLPECDTREVHTALTNALKQSPMDVKKMKIIKKSYDDQANYLIYFKKSAGITLLHLKSVTGILGYRVNFSKYQKGSQPTQCYNCQRYSHASSNCWLDPRCMRCGGSHKSSDCVHVDKTTKKVPEDKVKCINCGGSHTSNSKDCPTRIKLMKDRRELATRRHHTANQTRYVNNYSNNYDSHFPETLKSNRFVNTTRNVTDSRYAPYSKVLTQTTQPPNNSNTAFTPSQLMTIFREMIQICSSCQTAGQQLSALAEIVEKYLCHD